jgi:hypothetical protein
VTVTAPPSPSSSKTDRLRRMTRPLKPVRPPFYVQHATPACRMVGWWWQPANAPFPVPLGASYELALLALSTLIEGFSA